MAVITTDTHAITIRRDQTAITVLREPRGLRVTQPVTTQVKVIGGGAVLQPNQQPQVSGPVSYGIAVASLNVGMPVRLTAAGLELSAGLVGYFACIGVALEDKLSGMRCLYASDGVVTRQDWTIITGTGGLLPGSPYFLAPFPGKLTAMLPTEGVIMRVGVALNTTTLDIELGYPVVLSSV